MGTPVETRLSKALALAERLTAENKALRAEVAKPKPDPAAEALRREVLAARARLRELEREIAPHRDAQAFDEAVARELKETKAAPWLLKPKRIVSGPGVPVFNMSDLHMNEVVRPEEIAYKNEFSPEIAQLRLRRVTQNALDIAFNHMVLPPGWKYPGMVVLLGGDLFDNLSGRVHKSDPAFLPLRQSLTLVINSIAQSLRALYDEFHRLVLVCVPGNHGRTTDKMPMSGVADSSLDAVIYDRLQEHHLLAGLDIEWQVAAGDEARFLVYDHAHVLTHGYQYRGGDGEVGALGPVTRGVKRLRSKYRQLGLAVDTVVVEHFHHLLFEPGDKIMNGSLKGYDSMAMRYSFGYQPAMLGMWFVHPERGITVTWGVHAEEKQKKPGVAWASVERAA